MVDIERPDVPELRRLDIFHFRGIRELSWMPKTGLNIILGGGDVGKTTILDAIALLLSPSNSSVISETDFYLRQVDTAFTIEGIISLPISTGIQDQRNTFWPWLWDGKAAILPSPNPAEPDPSATHEPVYRIRVTGTPDFELIYEIVDPNGSTNFFPVGLRQGIGLIRLSGDDRNDKDLRLVYGSALDRLLSDRTLRSRVAAKAGKIDVQSELEEQAKERLKNLNTEFAKHNLPKELAVGIVAGAGFSLNSLVGLTAAGSENVKLPLLSWGAGTRRLAALHVAESLKARSPIVLVDEIERGLEPYRLRTLLTSLDARLTQTFITTHSPIALKAAQNASVWYLDSRGVIAELSKVTAQHRTQDPEAYLSRLSIICEGITEVGFVKCLLRKAITPDLESLGIWVSNGGGNEKIADILLQLSQTGICFSGFADNDGTKLGTWKKIKEHLGGLLFQWESGCLEHNIISFLNDDQLEQLILPLDGEPGARLRTLAERLGAPDKEFRSLQAEAIEKGISIRQIVIEASTGTIPKDTKDEDKKRLNSHERQWFKSEKGGGELAEKVFTLGIWQLLRPKLMPFLEAVATLVRKPIQGKLNER